jgi:anti-anti-sigma factor
VTYASGRRHWPTRAASDIPDLHGSPRPYLAIVTVHRDRRSVMRLCGELDGGNRDHLRRAIRAVLSHHHPLTLTIDLSALSFTDCAGLSVMVWAHKLLAEQGRELVITGAQPSIRRLLHLTDLDTYLRLSTSEPRAARPR